MDERTKPSQEKGITREENEAAAINEANRNIRHERRLNAAGRDTTQRKGRGRQGSEGKFPAFAAPI